ncbi:hypothetical protein BDW02DRAFT_573593 [Decorospora gaudefroyi]|uniref:Heterokaryon incompatibility domain-containing protein n=1 Tax=Decorospora gaudefroyi TaxID=184978 RepID=A0A6A5K907_9PLEO|nr:hypothetical protein BDW02DRAFT_573593 [Decorospora gaudefroyi]
MLTVCLKVHKLDAECEYKGTSYTWADHPECSEAIISNGQILKIAFDSYALLMARVRWADAVCINQSDTTEMAQQGSPSWLMSTVRPKQSKFGSHHTIRP